MKDTPIALDAKIVKKSQKLITGKKDKNVRRSSTKKKINVIDQENKTKKKLVISPTTKKTTTRKVPTTKTKRTPSSSSDGTTTTKSNKNSNETDHGLDIDPNLLFLPNDGLSKSMDPYDRFDNNSPDKVMDANSLSQKSKSTHILTDRGKQTILNLSHDKSHPYYSNELSTPTARLNVILPRAIYPMQRFLENGFIPVDNMNPMATIACITRNLTEECEFIADQKIDEAKKKAKSNNNSKGKNGDIGDDGMAIEGNKKIDLANTKLTQLWGEDQYHSFGYHRRRPKELQAAMDKSYLSEKLENFKACYEYDCIEPDVNFGTIPSGMRMFTQIYDKYYALYKADDQIIFDSTAMTPKIEIEVLERNYLRKYRMKPEPNEKVELCSRGNQCVFMVLIKAGHQGYVARVFYTKNEIKSGIIHNTEKLCIDCLLKLWTRTHDLNIFHEITVDKAMNYFSVICAPNEYSQHCMLTVIENGRRTGIEKHVPRFSENLRHNVTIVKEYDEGRQLHTTYTPYLAEIGMDF